MPFASASMLLASQPVQQLSTELARDKAFILLFHKDLLPYFHMILARDLLYSPIPRGQRVAIDSRSVLECT